MKNDKYRSIFAKCDPKVNNFAETPIINDPELEKAIAYFKEPSRQFQMDYHFLPSMVSDLLTPFDVQNDPPKRSKLQEILDEYTPKLPNHIGDKEITLDNSSNKSRKR